MKRFIFCLVLLLCGGIGFTEEKEDVSFAADIPFGEGNISMHFHFNPSTSACAVGEEEYYKKIEGEELTNFKNATKAYLRLIKQSIYK